MRVSEVAYEMEYYENNILYCNYNKELKPGDVPYGVKYLILGPEQQHLTKDIIPSSVKFLSLETLDCHNIIISNLIEINIIHVFL